MLALKAFDKWPRPVKPPTKTVFGGIVGIITYLVLAAFLGIYLKTASEKEYDYTTGIKKFPTESCTDDPDLCEMLPSMNCIAPSGCFVKGMNSAVINAADTCFYLAAGEAFPVALRRVVYAGDPAELLLVLSTDGTSASSSDGFARQMSVSYESTVVEEYREPLKTETVEAATGFDMATAGASKIYKGTSIMNLIKTVGTEDGDVVDAWSNTLTTTASGESASMGACCSNVAGLFKNTDGSAFTGTLPSCTDIGASEHITTIQPASTYILITVLDPFDVGQILGLVGGWLGVLGLFGGILVQVRNTMSPRKAAATDDASAGDVELAANKRLPGASP